MKKIISLILCVAMMCGALTAFAGFKDVEDNIAIDTLHALGVVDGDGTGKFNPDAEITRAEMCKIVVEALNLSTVVYPSDLFIDVPYNWAHPYIYTARHHSIIRGYGDGKFGPTDPVTYDQAMTIILNALGYKDAYLVGTWPSNVQIAGAQLKLYANVENKGAVPATRADVAQMLYNALNVPCVEIVPNIFGYPQVKDTDDTFLTKMGYTAIEDSDPIIDDFDTFGHYVLTYKQGKKPIKTDIIISKEIAATYKNGYLTTADGEKIKVSGLKDVDFFYNGEETASLKTGKNYEYKVITLNDEIKNIVVWGASITEIYNKTAEEIEDMFDYIDIYDYVENESVITSYGEFAFISNDVESFEVEVDRYKNHYYLFADEFGFDYEAYLTDEDAEKVCYMDIYFDYFGNPVVIRFYDEDGERVIATESTSDNNIVYFDEDDFIR